jgi:NAD(P)-dependent dehydrogenase (short-subunit alcohol dehydrogenase family)
VSGDRTSGDRAGEVAFITGAGSGIGAATARRLAASGVSVAAFDRSQAGVERIVAEIRAGGGEALALTGDVSEDARVADAVAETVRTLGPLATVVAAAGIEMRGSITEITIDDWRRTLDINLTGVFITARYGIGALISHGGGSFVAVSSDVGFQGSQGEIAYTASKHGVVGLVRCLAIDHGRQGVRANAVCPGFVATPMAERWLGSDGDRAAHESEIPLGRFALPDEVARVIAHLTSLEAAHTTGLVYVIDGGTSAGAFTATPVRAAREP